MTLPSITLTGNLTSDLELRFTQTGKAVAGFTVACADRKKEGAQWVDGDTTFVRCNVWEKVAEHAAESLRKGDAVTVTGRLRQREWETDGGEKRTSFEVTVDTLGASLQWGPAKTSRALDDGTTARPASASAEQPTDPPW